jgi:hypothetical protein
VAALRAAANSQQGGEYSEFPSFPGIPPHLPLMVTICRKAWVSRKAWSIFVPCRVVLQSDGEHKKRPGAEDRVDGKQRKVRF